MWIALLCYVSHVGSFSGLLSVPEEEGDMFLQNVGWLSTDCMALYLRR
jgi:hypothetical protein